MNLINIKPLDRSSYLPVTVEKFTFYSSAKKHEIGVTDFGFGKCSGSSSSNLMVSRTSSRVVRDFNTSSAGFEPLTSECQSASDNLKIVVKVLFFESSVLKELLHLFEKNKNNKNISKTATN